MHFVVLKERKVLINNNTVCILALTRRQQSEQTVPKQSVNFIIVFEQ